MNSGARGNHAGPFEMTAPLAASAAIVQVVMTHGRGKLPRQVRWVLRCKVGDIGFPGGAEVEAAATSWDTVNIGLQPTMWATQAQVGLTLAAANNSIKLFRPDTGAFTAITYVRWELKVYVTFP